MALFRKSGQENQKDDRREQEQERREQKLKQEMRRRLSLLQTELDVIRRTD